MRRGAALVAMGLLAGCRGSETLPGYAVRTGGDPHAGQAAITARHCGVCHEIPDVTGAYGVIGPALGGFARRSFIAGEVPNTPTNLVSWLRRPQQIEPHTAMPTLGLGEQEARDVAAYLYTLREEDR
jgi:cytochrome c2